MSTALFDQTTTPPLRQRLGSLLASASHADFAIRHIRIARIDLGPAEIRPLQNCRVLVNRLDAADLHDHAPHHTDARRRLLEFASSGRLHVRVAPTTGWNPDFSLFFTTAGTARCLLGSHYFQEPDPPDGPAFTALIEDPASIRLARHRYDHLWDAGYDVLPAVIHALQTLIRQ